MYYAVIFEFLYALRLEAEYAENVARYGFVTRRYFMDWRNV
jgi:hypothetical protein